jgi:AcrR family transcriptional regulator
MAVAEAIKEKPNRMERRRLKTRAKLLNATLRLIVKKGIDKTTMDDITETADLGRRTLYYHFASKDECILAAVADVYEQRASLAEQSLASSDDPAVIMATHGLAVLRGIMQEPVTSRLVEHPRLLARALTQAISRFALRDIGHGISEGRFTLTMSEQVLNSILIWSLVGVLVENATGELTPEETLPAYIATVLANLGISGEEAAGITSKAVKDLAI